MMDGCANLILNLSNSGNRIYLNNVTALNAVGSLIHHGASSDASIYINNSPTVGNIVSGASTNSGVFWTQDQVTGLSGAAPAIDAKLATTFLHTNSGANPTFANPIWSGYPGYGHITIQLILTEDATGNHVYAFGSKFLFTSAFVQPGVGSASKKTLLAFTFNGANWIQVGSTNVWY